MSLIVAIDGPAGAGKSTIAKSVAKKLGAIYVDTGAMYRAMALHMINNNISSDDVDGICKQCADADISIVYENGEQVVKLGGQNVNGLIRTEAVGNMASSVAVHTPVREKMVDLQRQIAKIADVVMDGRDIGTVVLPHANPKIYLSASSKVRAERRAAELRAKGEEVDIEVIEKDIIERDYRDMNREVSPLKKADDAIEIDSSYMSIEEVENAILNLCKR